LLPPQHCDQRQCCLFFRELPPPSTPQTVVAFICVCLALCPDLFPNLRSPAFCFVVTSFQIELPDPLSPPYLQPLYTFSLSPQNLIMHADFLLLFFADLDKLHKQFFSPRFNIFSVPEPKEQRIAPRLIFQVLTPSPSLLSTLFLAGFRGPHGQFRKRPPPISLDDQLGPLRLPLFAPSLA